MGYAAQIHDTTASIRGALVALSAVLSLVAFAPPSAAEQRSAKPHEHGHSRMSIAIEGNKVAIELEAPGADIVGFEHEARTDAERATLAQAKAKLADPLAMMGVPAEASCKLVEADVDFGADAHEDHADGKHADHKHDDHKHADHKHDDEAHDGHAEFRAAYALTCAAPQALTRLSFRYFEWFSGAEELDVAVVTDKSQATFEVTRSKPVIDLGGLM